jgi:hypothetical protein
MFVQIVHSCCQKLCTLNCHFLCIVAYRLQLFTQYQSTLKFGGFTELFALLLQETLHKRITLLTAKKIIPLSVWASQNNVKANVAANKAKRQTIPAFRLREKWMIAEAYKPTEP